MNPVSADDLLPSELAALLLFHAESGVAWLSEEEAVDRFGESTAVSPEVRPATPAARTASAAVRPTIESRPVASELPPAGTASAVAVPDAEAVESARAAAAGAATVEALVAAVETFSACNLRFSARQSVFAAGNPRARVIVLGGVPSADDDREGRPFSGSAGRILTRMMTSIGFGDDELLLANTIPWRPPGNRAPTAREAEICAPFARRLIEIVRPDAVLVLGNHAVRYFSDEPRAGIHALRGKWFDIVADDTATIRAFATFHPEDLVATPISKRLAWQDLLRFRAELGRSPAAAQ